MWQKSIHLSRSLLKILFYSLFSMIQTQSISFSPTYSCHHLMEMSAIQMLNLKHTGVCLTGGWDYFKTP